MNVAAGHVAAWVGVGGPGQGANGEDAWLQVGIASVEGTAPYLYAEVVRDGRQPQLMLLDQDLRIGVSRRVAVLETAERPGSWRVWVDGSPVTKPIHLRESSGRWAPIATAESFDGGESGCNRFAFRFERVSVSYDTRAARGARSCPGTASWTTATSCSRSRSRHPPRPRTRSSRRRSRPSELYGTILIGVPTGMRARSQRTSSLCRRTQPCETFRPRSHGHGVPCTPTIPPPGQSESFE